MKLLVLFVAVLAVGTVSANPVLGGLLGDVGGLIGTVTNVTTGVVGVATQSATGLLPNISGVLNNLIGPVEANLDSLLGCGGAVNKLLNKLTSALGELFCGVQGTINDRIDTLGKSNCDAVGDAVGTVEFQLNQLLGTVNYILAVNTKTLFDNLDAIIAGLVSSVQDLLQTNIDVIGSFGASVTKLQQEAICALQIVLQTVVKTVNDILVEVVIALLSDSGLGLSEVPARAQNAIAGALATVNGIIGSIANNVNISAGSILSLLQPLSSATNKLFDDLNVRDIVNKAVQAVQNIVRQILSGDINGALNSANQLANDEIKMINNFIGVDNVLKTAAQLLGPLISQAVILPLNAIILDVQGIITFTVSITTEALATAAAPGGFVDSLNNGFAKIIVDVRTLINQIESSVGLNISAELIAVLNNVVAVVVAIVEDVVSAVQSLLQQLLSDIEIVDLNVLTDELLRDLTGSLGDPTSPVNQLINNLQGAVLSFGTTDDTLNNLVNSPSRTVAGLLGSLTGTLNCVLGELDYVLLALEGLNNGNISALVNTTDDAAGSVGAAIEILLDNVNDILDSLANVLKGLSITGACTCQ